MKYNDTPFDESASPEVKALEFDLQIAENKGDPNPKSEAHGNWAPYNNDSNRKGDR